MLKRFRQVDLSQASNARSYGWQDWNRRPESELDPLTISFAQEPFKGATPTEATNFTLLALKKHARQVEDSVGENMGGRRVAGFLHNARVAALALARHTGGNTELPTKVTAGFSSSKFVEALGSVVGRPLPFRDWNSRYGIINVDFSDDGEVGIEYWTTQRRLPTLAKRSVRLASVRLRSDQNAINVEAGDYTGLIGRADLQLAGPIGSALLSDMVMMSGELVRPQVGSYPVIQY